VLNNNYSNEGVLLNADDETSITEISFLPDGRICVFGSSREVLEVLESLELGDPELDARIEHLRRQAARQECSS
jgi:hypothetical protein